MNRLLVGAFARAALAVACLAGFAAPIVAQVYVSPVQLADGNGDGIIKLSKARGPFKAKQTITFCPAAAPYTYVRGVPCPPIVAAPPVTPPVTPPSSPVLIAIVDGEGFMQDAALTFSVNRFGGIGAVGNAPAGFRTDRANGWGRVALKSLISPELLANGMAPNGHVGPGYRNLYPVALSDSIVGTVSRDGDALVWQGGGIVLRYTLDSVGIHVTGSSPSQLVYAIDPDEPSSDILKSSITTNTLTATGARAKTASGYSVSLSGDCKPALVEKADMAKLLDPPASGSRKGDDSLVQICPAGQPIKLTISVG